MNNKLLILFLSITSSLFAQADKNPCETLLRINYLIQQQHYKAKALNDSLSSNVFELFLKKLDDDNRLFTEIEINYLKKHKFQIDDYIRNENCNFLADFYQIYTYSVERYAGIIETIKKEPFEFKSSEKMQFSKKAFPYVKNEAELKGLYKKRILFNILKDISEISKNKDSLVANFDTLSESSKNKIFESFTCKTSSFQLTKKEFNSKFFGAFCNYFDPHTEYFSESDKSSFLSAVSADNLTFGMIVSLNENDEIIVEEILPGSSAHQAGTIEIGDQIVKIKYLNDEYLIACSSMQKIEALFSSSEFKKVEFTLRKKNGELYNVVLTKKIMKDYENNVYSYLLEKDNKKIGYIRIPSFYGIFEDGKTNVSDDVIKEVSKLKEDNINGLIIDLQNNGGGSMEEAVKLSGVFIDSGPVAILSNKKGETQTLKDTNNGSIYDGPLVVLINAFSASASEFFSNAMQDYGRAIVIGTQSYGKASMQRIYPLSFEEKPSEFVKLTIEEFYRITGKTNQTIGTTPDVKIPILFDGQMPRESNNETALVNDFIQGVSRFTPFQNPFKSAAIAKSKIRIHNNTDAQLISEMNSKIDKIYDGVLDPIELDFNSVFYEINKMNSFWTDIKNLSEKEYPINIEVGSVDLDNQEKDEFLKNINSDKIKALKCNFPVVEALNIIHDLLNSR